MIAAQTICLRTSQLDKPFASYTGADSYVFVCYAHVDQQTVYPEITVLKDSGINIWYDEGISGGRVWRREVGSAIENADCVLFYVSEASLRSDHCSREINFALDQHKKIIPVYLEDVELTTDLKVGLSSIQALHRNRDSRYLDHLIGALAKNYPVDVIAMNPVRAQKKHWSTGLAFLALALLGLAFYLFLSVPEEVGIPVLQVKSFEHLETGPHSGLEYELQRRLAASSELFVVTEEGRTDVGYFVEGRVADDTVQLSLRDKGGSVLREWKYPASSDLAAAASGVSKDVLEEFGFDLTVLDRFKQVIPAEAFRAYLQAMMLLRQSHSPESLDEAMATLQRVLSQVPRYAPAHAGLCSAYLASYLQARVGRDFQLAESHCFRALTLDDLDHNVHLALGTLYRESGQHEKAVTSLHRSLELSPFSTAAMRELGSTLARQGRVSEAIGWYRKAIQVEPSHWENYQTLAIMQFISGDYDNSLESFEFAFTLAPDELSILNNIGAVYFRQGEYTKAIERWEELAREQPRSEVYANLGTAHYFQREFLQSAGQYRKAAALTPNDYRYLGEIGNVLYVSGDERYTDYFMKAIAMAKQQLVIDPADDMTIASIAGFHAALGDVEKSQLFRNRVSEAGHTNVDVLYQLAVSHARGREYERTGELLQRLIANGYERKLIELDSNFDQALQYLAE